MNWEKFGNKLSAAGTLLTGGSVATALLTAVPPDAPAGLTSSIHMIAICTVILGAFASAVGKLMHIFASEEPLSFPAGKTFVLALCLLALPGCVTGTAARKQAEDEMVRRYEAAEQNQADFFDAQEKALKFATEKDLTFRLNTAIANVQEKAKTDPAKYPAADAAAEIARLWAVYYAKREQFAGAQQQLRDLKERNDATNLAGARKIYETIKRVDKQPPVNLTAAVNGVLGKPPPPATLIELEK